MRPQDLVLTICGAHARRPRVVVWSGGVVELLREFGFSTEASRAALARLVTRGLLIRLKQGRLAYYSLSDRAQHLLQAGDARIYSYGRSAPSAERWTILWHFIPEERRVERSQLASQLRFLGFGSVQDATWIAAGDREQAAASLLEQLGVAEHSAVVVGRLSDELSPAILIAEAWDLQAVAARHQAFVDEFGGYRSARAQARLGDREAFVIRTRALHAFRGFPTVDPELPDGVGGDVRARNSMVRTFDALYRGLEQPADRHFAEVAGVPEDVCASMDGDSLLGTV